MSISGCNRERRGFSLLLVVIIVAMMTIVAAALLDSLGLELSIIGRRREAWTSRQIADSGAKEMLSDTLVALPDFASEDLAVTYEPNANSAATNGVVGGSYVGEFRLLRVVPVSESSEGTMRALVYEIQTSSDYRGESGAEARAEVYNVVAMPVGVVVPRRHAR